MKKKTLPLNLQFFSDGDGTGADGQQTQTQQLPEQSTTVDYAKIQTMLDGTLKAKEEVALKAYFKEQGLSQEEMAQAIGTFKQQRAASQPDLSVIQTQLVQAQAEAQKAMLDSAATMTAISLGIDVKSIPYLLKMADFSQAVKEGKADDEALKVAINKVLEDIPALKPQKQQQAIGFVQVGATGQSGQQSAADAELDRIFGVTKK